MHAFYEIWKAFVNESPFLWLSGSTSIMVNKWLDLHKLIIFTYSKTYTVVGLICISNIMGMGVFLGGMNEGELGMGSPMGNV